MKIFSCALKAQTALLILGIVAAACARGEPPAPASAAPESVSAAETEKKTVTASQPATVEVSLDPTLRETLRRAASSEGPPRPLRLTIVGVDPPPGAAMGVRVFLNLPRANVDTTLEDPHYVGAFTFFPADAPGDQNFLLDPAPALRRLGAAGQFNSEEPLTVTLVAFALDGKVPPPDEVIRFEKATLE